MKKFFLSVLFLLAGMGGHSQIINFPDANFKAKLLQSDTTNGIAQSTTLGSIKIDANNNGQIEVIEA